MSQSGISRDEWIKAVSELDSKPVPESDAVSTQEFAKIIGVSRSVAARRLTMLVEAGVAVRVTKLMRRQDNGVVSIPAYRLVKNATNQKGKDAANRSAPKIAR